MKRLIDTDQLAYQKWVKLKKARWPLYLFFVSQVWLFAVALYGSILSANKFPIPPWWLVVLLFSVSVLMDAPFLVCTVKIDRLEKYI